jgi:hypothetical protein
VAIPEVAYNLHPLSGASLSLPILASRLGRLKRGAYLAFLVPPGVGGLEGHNVAYPKLVEALFETLILAIERIGDYSQP